MESTLLRLDAQKFQQTTIQFQNERVFGCQYADEFVKELNALYTEDLTDLEDPEMDVEWLALKNFPPELSTGGFLGMLGRNANGGTPLGSKALFSSFIRHSRPKRATGPLHRDRSLRKSVSREFRKSVSCDFNKKRFRESTGTESAGTGS